MKAKAKRQFMLRTIASEETVHLVRDNFKSAKQRKAAAEEIIMYLCNEFCMPKNLM